MSAVVHAVLCILPIISWGALKFKLPNYMDDANASQLASAIIILLVLFLAATHSYYHAGSKATLLFQVALYFSAVIDLILGSTANLAMTPYALGTIVFIPAEWLFFTAATTLSKEGEGLGYYGMIHGGLVVSGEALLFLPVIVLQAVKCVLELILEMIERFLEMIERPLEYFQTTIEKTPIEEVSLLPPPYTLNDTNHLHRGNGLAE